MHAWNSLIVKKDKDTRVQIDEFNVNFEMLENVVKPAAIKGSTILPIMNNCTFKVHNGLKYMPIFIEPSMFGNRFGSYLQTKMRCVYRRRKNKKRNRRR